MSCIGHRLTGNLKADSDRNGGIRIHDLFDILTQREQANVEMHDLVVRLDAIRQAENRAMTVV